MTFTGVAVGICVGYFAFMLTGAAISLCRISETLERISKK